MGPQAGVRFRHWLRKVASNAIATVVTKSKPLGIVDGLAADQILAETHEVSAVKSELHEECYRERYLRAAAIVRIDDDHHHLQLKMLPMTFSHGKP